MSEGVLWQNESSPGSRRLISEIARNCIATNPEKVGTSKKWSPKRWQPTCGRWGRIQMLTLRLPGKNCSPVLDALSIWQSVHQSMMHYLLVCPSVYTAYVSVSSLVHQSMMHYLPASPSVYYALSTNQFISPCCIIYQLCHQSVMHYLLVGPSVLRNIFNMQYLVTPVFTSPRQSSTFKSTY